MFERLGKNSLISLLKSGVARLCLFVCFITLLIPMAQAGITVQAVRVWPAADYTRVTLESAVPISYKSFTVKNPERLVLDLENVDINKVLEGFTSKVGDNDPYIKSVRVGRFKPGVTRVVLDLKTEVNPSVFTLQPYGEYANRLVLDIYPAHPADPLMALLGSLKKEGNPANKTSSLTEDGAANQNDKPVEQASDSTLAKADSTLKPQVDRLVVVAIDAGHGGEDPGAKGHDGSYEKNVTLAIARKLKALMDNEPNMRGVLIRDGDYFIPLGGRTAKARRLHADLFVSIHADAYVNSDARGSSVFALSEHGATSAAARWLAKKENDADLMGGINIDVGDVQLKKTLLDLSQTATINDSLKLGKAVLSELGSINDLHKGRVEQAGFAVLKSPDIPSILVETGFITNPKEEKKLTDDEYQEKMAETIFSGIKRYFAQNPPLAKSRLARNP